MPNQRTSPQQIPNLQNRDVTNHKCTAHTLPTKTYLAQFGNRIRDFQTQSAIATPPTTQSPVHTNSGNSVPPYACAAFQQVTMRSNLLLKSETSNAAMFEPCGP